MTEQTLLELAPFDDETGEVIEPDGTAGDLTVGALTEYANAHERLQIVRLRIRDRLDRLKETDPEYADLVEQQTRLQMQVAAVEDALEGVFSDELRMRHARKIKLDVGPVSITWGKPRETWKQRLSPKLIVRRYPELAQRLGIEKTMSKPPKPRVTVRSAE